ncbi:septal ring lytic transglycosylase RlpA family protein [Aliikangiella coralliicola]|uniref:Endolytic peptidoglycan transglycosylase RlpA n=1 Tax=Aliikangiella coralliicola TaxID=2592383 RepID=A0A545U7J7_9GAMM|nr:septal ring lytic transglycosylase RlpA family protein [Aliikangiella coralliicola]TQV85442.1 septal ring lytic transglycosylase RlpA family protein [Aliikangiella coralliicola]
MNKLIKQPINLSNFYRLCCAGLSLLLAGCAVLPEEKDSAPKVKYDWAKLEQVTPKYEPKSRYGNPSSYEQDGKTYYVLASADNYKQRGIASWYGTKFHGRRTSSGESYDMFKMTAAHKTLPIPVYAKVTNLENGKQITVKINDRGPFKKGRIIDLSYAAAHKLGMAQKGTARVEVETITFSNNNIASTSDIGNKKRYVQVGAYSVYKTAQKLAKVLDREIRLPVKITTVKRGGSKLYRVRIGPVPSEELAQELVDTLDIKELGKPKVVYE